MKVRPCTLHGIEERSTAKISAGGRTGAAMGSCRAPRKRRGSVLALEVKGAGVESDAPCFGFLYRFMAAGVYCYGARPGKGSRVCVCVVCAHPRGKQAPKQRASGARGPQFKAQARLQFSQAHARAHAV